MPDIKLVCSDVAGTLVQEKSWLILTEGLGCSAEEYLKISDHLKGKETSSEKASDLLTKLYRESSNANEKFIRRLFGKIQVKREAFDLFSYLKKRAYQTFLISGAIDLYVESVARQLAVNGFFTSSKLIFGKSGILQKVIRTANEGEFKVARLKELVGNLGIKVDQATFIGDGWNDAEAFRATGCGIAVQPCDEELKRVAWKVVDSLSEIKEIL